jgi:hypothetical protein
VQSVSTVQLPAQAVAPQVNGAQVTSCSAGQEPAPLQEAAATATPVVQEGLRQVVVLPG